MLLRIGEYIVSSDTITQIEQLPDNRVRALTTTGASLIGNGNLDRLERLCGNVVPAQPGYRLIEVYEPWPAAGQAEATFVERDVIAFRITDDVDWPAMPITLAGEPDPYGDPFGIIEPSGRVRDGEGDWDTVAEFKTSMVARIAKRATEKTGS